MVVNVETKGDLAVVTINNPPVNAASHAVRAGLMAAIADTESSGAVRAVVLRADGRTFTAGADVREFDSLLQEPHLPDVILALEDVTKPWIAALHGTVLGGGLEIALGCSHRIAQPGTKLGLPEVTLGLIPGAGGTVRLPRLIDPVAALNMVVSGKPVSAEKALELGLIDDIADGDLTRCACAMAQKAADAPSRIPLGRRGAPAVQDTLQWEALKSKSIARARGAHAPAAAVLAIQRALDLPATEALKSERNAFMSLKSDPQSAALRYIFFAERSASKLPELDSVKPRSISSLGVIGGGTMGAGIAAACLLSGIPVTLVERDDAARTAGQDRVMGILTDSLNRGLIDQNKHEALSANLTTAITYDALAKTDLVIEAVFEDMALKTHVFQALDGVVRPESILASNTSYLDIQAIANQTRHPERVIGLHFFSPAHIMKLLEVVIPSHAAASAISSGFALAKRLGKIAVPAGVCDGFIGNRIMSAYRRECDYMIEDGALPWDIDRAMRSFGFPMGLFEMQDLAGLDIGWARRKNRAVTRDSTERYVHIADKLCEAGRFGRKTNKGWYEYNDGKATPSGWVQDLVLSESARKGITRGLITDEEINQRILSTIQTEAQALLAEGIARRPEDVDVVMVNGYGFPRWLGGPMYLHAHPLTAN
ncbi:3-hydroxyacyl-CoA dehydrogenase NAD-binding domain-containing protein [Ruegeria meonggei]|uniref:Fatty acid oxidation complex subunit alpha n=1 Tax=Ruegeria meonggei TaxID=1446476 RepID=A0A1X6YLU8_9RHOB|nr:3-hydroxyacyl-CoA dehydrogenase NAD-binding domain-containing protein [Ruegeria meonggei]SLN24590.1 Fatty acid oxidation complex subunit alpha [Ruegeria meonggei]